MSFEIKHTLIIISGSNWENPKHIELKANSPTCLQKKECTFVISIFALDWCLLNIGIFFTNACSIDMNMVVYF